MSPTVAIIHHRFLPASPWLITTGASLMFPDNSRWCVLSHNEHQNPHLHCSYSSGITSKIKDVVAQELKPPWREYTLAWLIHALRSAASQALLRGISRATFPMILCLGHGSYERNLIPQWETDGKPIHQPGASKNSCRLAVPIYEHPQ